jgi:hypothetical protein
MAVIEMRPVRQMPAWLSALIILACLALAGGVARWYWRGGWSDNIVMLDHNPGDGVHASTKAKNQWDATAGPAAAKIVRARDAKLNVSFFFKRKDFLSPEQIKLITAATQIAKDRRMQQDLEITPAQAQALAEVRDGGKIETTESEQRRISDAFLAWEKASGESAKNAADGDMVRVLDSIAAARLQATRASDAARAESAAKALTAGQWKQYDAIGQQSP